MGADTEIGGECAGGGGDAHRCEHVLAFVCSVRPAPAQQVRFHTSFEGLGVGLGLGLKSL